MQIPSYLKPNPSLSWVAKYQFNKIILMQHAKNNQTNHLILLLFTFLVLTACDAPYPGVPEKYHALLDSSFTQAGHHATELQNALNQAPANQKEGMAFLISYMPLRDLTTLKSDFLLENVDFAYKTRNAFAWSPILPDSIFFNEVLPYVSMNERRDNWRKDFYERFGMYVKGCNNIYAAIDSLNKHIKNELKVEYNTKREKPDQSPYESIELGMASCSGLSILLTDAFRAVGIPSRIAGTPNWHDNRGNHNWCEVWIDGEWYFTEYYPNALNKSWFLADAGKADANNPEHAIYASSFKPTGISFPLVWDASIDYVPAVNVSERYIQIYTDSQREKERQKNSVQVLVYMFNEEVCTLNSDNRVGTNIDVWKGDDQVGGGRTSSPQNDLNDLLTFTLDKNTDYSISYIDANDKAKKVAFSTKEDNMELKLYLK